MKIFKWKLDRSVINGNRSDDISDAELFLGYLNGACQSAYKDGLGRDLVRRLYNVSNKIESSKNDTVELEDAEFDLVSEAFERAKFNPAVSRMVVQIYDAIEAANGKR